jgi:hypothetical protein
LAFAATVKLKDQATNMIETFFLWYQPVKDFVPPELAVTEVSSLSLLRDALVNKLSVTVVTVDIGTSAHIRSVAVPP